MVEASGAEIQHLKVDGGASVNNLLMQIQANLLGSKVVRPAITETTALGASLLAGLAVGFWEDYADIKRRWSVDKTFEPEPGVDNNELIKYWYKAVNRSMNWVEN